MHIADVDAEAVQKIITESSATSGTVGDISNPADLDTLFHDVQRQLGGLDVLVDNAGIAGATAPVDHVAIAPVMTAEGGTKRLQ